MATAIEQKPAPRTPAPLKLPITSLIGAVYVLASVAVILYGIPLLWASVVGAAESDSWWNDFLREAVRVACAVGLIVVGNKLLGTTPQKGIRGGIFLVLVTAVLIFFIWRALAMSLASSIGMAVSLAVAGVLVFFAVRFLSGKTGVGWMVALEEQGWFHGNPYKRSLGQKVRRLTILGILLLGGSGIYSLYSQGSLPERWTLSMPFDIQPLLLLPAANLTGIALLVALTLWVAYRAVNVPTFAEFLIATEAEMNKVSWTPKKRLAQDTIVVLTTTLLMAMFLLVVDLFWGWLLSNSYVGVLPQKATGSDKGNAVQQAKW
jgi:preprotein translocase SecE subunit